MVQYCEFDQIFTTSDFASAYSDFIGCLNNLYVYIYDIYV